MDDRFAQQSVHGVTAEGIVESALDKVHLIEDMGYDNLVISIKSSDVMMCVKAHELIAEQTDHPLHVGITEAGTIISGNIKSFSSEPLLTPTRIGIFLSFATSTTACTRSLLPMLPGLILILSAPCSMAAIASR